MYNQIHGAEENHLRSQDLHDNLIERNFLEAQNEVEIQALQQRAICPDGVICFVSIMIKNLIELIIRWLGAGDGPHRPSVPSKAEKDDYV